MNAADDARVQFHKIVARYGARTFRHLFWIALYGVIGAVVVIVALVVVMLDRRPDLDVWHTASLDAEFTRDVALADFGEYMALEDRLFAQLDEKVYVNVPATGTLHIQRYCRGSMSDPDRWPTDWNRSFVHEVDEPRAGVLLIHGLSDSPYSMRSLADALHGIGATVVGLRVPGHGTAPSGLLRVDWEDMAAAVELAVRFVRDRVGDAPIHIVGYSNGGALAVHYALSTLDDASRPAVDGLVLLSPEIGISKMAALAVWQERLGRLLGLDKLAWHSINFEYDPFKYRSFTVNAGDEAYRLTVEIRSRLAAAADDGTLARFPRVLAFQSAVDATVLPEILVTELFEQLDPGGHELVLFDVNERAAAARLLRHDPADVIKTLSRRTDLPFALTLVTNESDESDNVVARRRAVGAADMTVTPLGVSWPAEMFSLSHVALPFPPDDPVYGGPDAGESPGVHIGNLAVRGERGAFVVSAADMLRIHWNPFHAHVVERVLSFVGE